MPAVKMHADEVDTDASLVGRLLAAQFPRWAGLPVTPVRPADTDNTNYRPKEDAAVRRPRRPRRRRADADGVLRTARLRGNPR
jgi:aminoglycoside phosphotransferase (APT) family kinase protein